MRSRYLILFLFTQMIIFFSCQKEIDFAINRLNDSNDSIYLKQYVELNSIFSPFNDTAYKVDYSYDGQKRVSQVVEFGYDPYGSPDTTISNYFYSGNDTLPFKVVENYNDGQSDFRATSFLFYNNGLVSKDSVIEYNSTTNQFFEAAVLIFTPSGNNTFIQSRGYNSFPPAVPDYQWSGMVMQTRTNGNIIMQDDTTTFNIVYTDRAHHLVSYDNHVNPFYRVEIPFPVLNKWKVQRNNVLEEKSWDVPWQLEANYQYNYIYRSDGYPLSVIITDLDNPSNTSKGLFFYTN